MFIQGKKCVVIGGCGFLGQHLVEALLEKGALVTAFDIRKTYSNDKVEFVIGDLCSLETLKSTLKDTYVVFHCASPPPELDDKVVFLNVNVKGTKKVIQACRETGVKRLVLTSTCSVIYEGKDLKNGDETWPYAKSPMDSYTETKILQEKEVLEANDENLMTVAIRPHGIFGPKDQAVSTMIAQAKKGMRFIIGDGQNIVDFTHVRNVVHGHIIAAEQLTPGSEACGQAFIITNDEPIGFWDFFGKVAEGMKCKKPSINLPYWLIYYISALVQLIVLILKPLVHIKVTLIPSRVSLAATHHYYNCTKAKRILSYTPIINLEDSIQQTLQYYSKANK